jgi:hypothetical protein
MLSLRKEGIEMERSRIVEFLEDNGLSEIEEIKYNDKVVLLKFDFDFDEEELEAARAYADDECEEEKEGDSWYDEYFLNYLNELAVDTVGEVTEDLMEELSLQAQFASYELTKENHTYNEFMCVFYENGIDVDLDEILDEIDKR